MSEGMAELRDRVAELEKSLENARKERDEAWEERASSVARLPDGMKHCTIRFMECEKGHGWLTATNWVPHGCPTCERDALRAELARLKPSGQVAGDVGRFAPASGNPPETYTVGDVRDAVIAFVRGDESQALPFRNAIANGVIYLAAKAQACEQEHALRMTRQTDADAANSAKEVALRERDAAVADNAGLLKNALAIIDHFTHPERGTGQWTPDLSRMAAEIKASRHPGAALLEQHRKEVDQARNDGLELAADMAWANDPDSPLAAGIRAMKTCTDGSCAKCRSGEPCR